MRRLVPLPKSNSRLFAALAFVLAAAPAFAALSIPDRPNSYVNDYADAISSDTEARLEDALGRFERETSNQVVVAVFESLSGEVLEDTTIRLAQKWKVGQAGKDNGVILAVFMVDRAVRIETGYGLEGALPDATAHAIIRNEIVPAFRAGNVDAGIERGVAAILAATRGEYKVEPPGPDRGEMAKSLFWVIAFFFFAVPVIAYGLTLIGCTFLFGFPVGLVIGIFLVAILQFLRNIFLRGAYGQTIGSGGRHWGGGGFGGGSGGFGGGGFGGGGGGSFGGGGASGRW